MDGYLLNENRVLLNSLTKACKIKNDIVTTRLPITLGLLEVILFEVPRILPCQPYLCVMYQTLFALAYYGLFRIGELTTGDHSIRGVNVHVSTNKNTILFVLFRQKPTDRKAHHKK